MLPNSLRIRGIRFAFLFGPPRFVKREEASKVHGDICDALGQDDLSLQYSSPSVPKKPDSKGFRIALEREEGRGSFGVTIDNRNVNEPIRLLLAYTWPPSLVHAKQMFDMAADATFSSLEGDWQRVLAEVRLRAQCDTRDDDGLAFLNKAFFGPSRDWVEGLGAVLSFCSVNFEVPPAPPEGDDQLRGAKRELVVELLREDPGGLYFELLSQWPQISPIPRAPGPMVDLRSIRRIDLSPGEYVEDAFGFLRDRVESLATSQGDQ